MLHGTAKEDERQALASLIAYTKAHFTHEEEVMIRHKYPDLQKHKAEHDAFALKVVELQSDYENGRTALSIAIMHFLKNWLAHHICEVDNRVAEHIRSTRRATA
jgi:hemerythrin